MSISLIRYAGVLLFLFLLAGCKKEQVNQYEIDEITLYSNASEKKNLKTDEQFLSILYSDLFDKSISAQEMSLLTRSYTALGDKALVIDMLTKTMLISPDANVPSPEQMHEHPEVFVEEAFKRFYIRKPNVQESWFFTNLIVQDTSIKPVDVYYSMLTADEYRYY